MPEPGIHKEAASPFANAVEREVLVNPPATSATERRLAEAMATSPNRVRACTLRAYRVGRRRLTLIQAVQEPFPSR